MMMAIEPTAENADVPAAAPQNSNQSKTEFSYSVVVPVFNEADNIGNLCRTALKDLPGNYELLICYDFDGDSTLPALKLPDSSKKTFTQHSRKL